MFSVEHGWLAYAPFEHYQLPTFTFDENDREPRLGQDVGYLRWPGKMRQPPRDPLNPLDLIPGKILYSWKVPIVATLYAVGTGPDDVLPTDMRNLYDIYTDQGVSLANLVRAGQLPKEIPSCVAYHLAVNHHYYWACSKKGQPYTDYLPVGGLSGPAVFDILNARFRVTPTYHAALTYLKWLAENHRSHPLFRSFDTNIREMLVGVTLKTVQLYFQLLGDCLIDPDTGKWTREPSRYHWWRLATYMHWLGRTGNGLLTLDDCSALDDLLDASRGKPLDQKTFLDEEPWVSLRVRLEEFRILRYNREITQIDRKGTQEEEDVQD